MQTLNIFKKYFEEVFAPISMQRLIEEEKRLGFQLPELCRSFLLDQNGGILKFDRNAFTVEINEHQYSDCLQEISGINQIVGSYFGAIEFQEDINYPNFFHNEMLCLGSTTTGGGIYIGYNSKNCGKIYWINYVSYDFIEEKYSIFPVKIADNLIIFLESLTSLDAINFD